MKIHFPRSILFLLLIAAVSCRKERSHISAEPLSSKQPVARQPTKEFTIVASQIGRMKKLSPEERERSLKTLDFRDKRTKLSADELGMLIEMFDLGAECNDQIVCQALDELASKNPAMFLQYASKLGKSTYVTTESSVLGKAIKADRGAVLTWLRDGKINSDVAFLLAYRLMVEVSNKNPADEVRMILERDDRTPALLDLIYGQWSKENLDEAMSNARKSLAGTELARAQINILNGGSMVDAAEAYRMAETIDPTVVGEFYGGIFGDWIKQDFSGATAALETMPPERVQIVLGAPGLAEAVAGRNPSAAFEAMSKLVFSESTKPLFMRVVIAAGKNDSEATKNWVSGFPESPTKEALLGEIEKLKD